jgi:hypothetical protein
MFAIASPLAVDVSQLGLGERGAQAPADFVGSVACLGALVGCHGVDRPD